MNMQYPNHVAIILDGNRRWAKKRNLPTLLGHKEGLKNIQNLVPYIINKGVKYLSVFAFSTENFKRSAEEVNYLMDLFVNWFNKEMKKIHKENIKIIFSGRRENLREDVKQAMDKITSETAHNTKGIFNVCLNYGGQQEIVDATKKIIKDYEKSLIKIADLNENTMYKYMYNELPPIDFLIRTSGEERISNFMMYELSYAELYFTPVLFPDFNEVEFEKAITEYNKRNRRFGGNDKNETKSN